VSFETKLFTRLSSQLTTSVGTRIYPAVAPQTATLPYIVYRKVSANKQYAHSGPLSLTFDRVQVSVFSTGYLAGKTIAGNAITALEGWTDAQAVFKANELDLYEPDTKVFHIPVDFLIWHNM
jgi:hypothetical protein